MTTTDKTVTITVLRSGLTVPHNNFATRVALRGEVITLTPEQVQGTEDRYGASWLQMTDAEQEARWGEVKFVHGDHAEGIAFLGDDDSTIRFRRRENAVLAARKIANDAERREAFRKINETYGHADSGQRSTAYAE